MKKIITAIITCTIVVLTAIFLTYSDSLENRIIDNIKLEEVDETELVSSNTNYWYYTLNESQQKIYRIIANGVNNLDKIITIEYRKNESSKSDKGNIEKVVNAFFADNPDIFYIKDKYEISVTNLLVLRKVDLKLEYISSDVQEIERMKKSMESEIDKINNRLVNCKTDYEKELLLHDSLAKQIVYFEHENYDEIPTIKHTAYSALVEGSAVCDGITKAFQLILAKNNIESIFVTGLSEDTPHAWCKVKLDEQYYNVDVTADKVLNKEDSELVIHSYFNITDEEISKTHTFDDYDKLPMSKDSKFNYYENNDYSITNLDTFEYKLNQIIQKQKNSKLLEFKVTGIKNVPSKMVETLYRLNFNNYKSRNITEIEYNQINNNYIIVK